MTLLAMVTLLGFGLSRGHVQGVGVWPSLVPAQSPSGGGEADTALIVSVEDYANVPDVVGAVENGKAWYLHLTETLKVPSGRVRWLSDREAAKEGIEEELERVVGQAKAGGRLWFIFIGHGTPSAKGDDGLLVGVDARQDIQSLKARSLSRAWLLKQLEKAAGEKLVVLDTCFSGRTSSGDAFLVQL